MLCDTMYVAETIMITSSTSTTSTIGVTLMPTMPRAAAAPAACVAAMTRYLPPAAPSTFSDSFEPARSKREGDEVGGEAEHRDDEHRRVVDVRSVPEATDRLDQDVGGDAGEQHGVGQGGEDLQAVQPERAVPALAATAGELDRRQGHADADHVGDHVAGVGEQGQRVRQQPGDDLDDHEHGEHDEGGEQRTACAVHRPAIEACWCACRDRRGSSPVQAHVADQSAGP